jgi:hypothetical protein
MVQKELQLNIFPLCYVPFVDIEVMSRTVTLSRL